MHELQFEEGDAHAPPIDRLQHNDVTNLASDFRKREPTWKMRAMSLRRAARFGFKSSRDVSDDATAMGSSGTPSG